MDIEKAPISLMVLFEKSGFPPDIRVQKEIDVLEKNGWKVLILTFKVGDQASYEIYGLRSEIIRIEYPFKNKIKQTLFFLHPYSYYLKQKIEYLINDKAPNIIHVHDLTYLGTVLKAKRNTSLKIIADLHENMPAAYVAYRKNKPMLISAVDWIFKNYNRWKRFERKWISKVDKVFVVVEESKKRFIKNNLNEDNIVVVSNTENFETFPESKNIVIENSVSTRQKLLYIGGIGPHRGIDTVLEGLSLSNQKEKIIVRIVGLGDSQKKEMEKVVTKLNIVNSVELVGWVKKDMVAKEIAVADWGIIPHAWTTHTNTTIPHKLFQFMIMGKPVIVSSCYPLKRIISTYNAGLIFDASNPNDFAKILDKTVNLNDEKIIFSENGRKACMHELSWTNDAKRLMKSYNNLIDKLHL